MNERMWSGGRGGSVRCVERLKALRCFDCDTGNKSA